MLWRMSVDSHPRGSTDGRFPTTGCPNDAPSGQGSSRSSPARCPVRPTAGAACCAASRAKPHFSGAMAPENSIHRLPHSLDEPTNKRRKGRKPPAPSGALESPTLSIARDAHRGRRFAPLGVVETPCPNFGSRTCPQFCCLTHGMQSKPSLACHLRELRKLRESAAAGWPETV